MNPLVTALMNELVAKHGSQLDLKNEHYTMICSDGVFTLYLDQEEKSLKVNIELTETPKCYFSELSISELMEQK